MERAEKGDEKSPLLQIDPKCFQDALRAFFQPIKTNDPRVDFYTMYKREATEYDADYVKKYDEDLNTTLIFAGLFSAVSSAFVIDVHSNLQPDPNEQSAALLRAILLTLNQSAISGETPIVPPVQGNPPSEIVTVTCLMYASLMISLLAAFVAMLGKQWLNRYLRNSGGSMIERCGDRQRKCDGLEKWPLHFFVESLPVMLQVSLLLLACGLCRHMWSVSAPVARTLIGLTGLGVVFYVAIVIVGMSSYGCPFQTPVSIALRGPWKKVRRGVASSVVHSKRVISWIHRMWNKGVRPLLRRQSLQTSIPLGGIQVQQSKPWLKPKDLDILHRTDTNDARCVSWILRSITDPEALDAAIRLAGEIRWFDDGVNVNPPYDLIVATFEACFDSTRTLYPGSRDRAYYSGRAMIWIRALAMCKSEEFATIFPLPDVEYTTPVPDPDLEHLLQANSAAWDPDRYIARLLRINPGHTPPHSQWISNLLLQHSRADQTKLDYQYILHRVIRAHETETTIPLNATLNRLLMWCTFLGSPVEEEALMVQDKSDRMEPILDRLSNAVLSAINGTSVQRGFIQDMLRDLAKLETRPGHLTEIVYGWCSVIFENRESLQDWEKLLLVCLEIGFRHLDFRSQYIEAMITHTEHHRGLVDVVFESQEGEVIADLLHAWTTEGGSHGPAHELLGFCARHLVSLHNLVPFSARLRRLVIRSVEVIGYGGLKEVGVERFIGLLNHLHVTAEDMDNAIDWARLLLNIIQFSEGAQHLSHWYWECLVELAVSRHLVEPAVSQPAVPWEVQVSPSWRLELSSACSLEIITSLIEGKDWSKLECWMGMVWMSTPWNINATAEGHIGHSMVLLFRHRPGAVQKLEQWMERSHTSDIPESLKQICRQAHESAQRNAPPISSTSKGTEGFVYTLPDSPRPSGGDEF